MNSKRTMLTKRARTTSLLFLTFIPVSSLHCYSLILDHLSDKVNRVFCAGLEMHVILDYFPKPQEVAANMQRLAAIGLQVQVTE